MFLPRCDVFYHGRGVGAADDILLSGFEFKSKTVVARTVVSEKRSDHRVVEIAPIAHEAAASAKAQASGRRVASLRRMYVGVREKLGLRQQAVDFYP